MKCEICGGEFETTDSRKKCCSYECQRLMEKKRKREHARLRRLSKPLQKKKCEICGTEFETVTNRKKYCDKCAAVLYRKQTKMSKERIKAYKAKLKELNATRELAQVQLDAEIMAMPITKLPSCGDGTPPPAKKIVSKNKMDRIIMEAAECGLSYGRYKFETEQRGKTFAQLKSDYESKKSEENLNVFWWRT